ncbi:hypothetical protein RND71_001966 [Anisodus tanguticus]|uniref:Uncharacterized protein n=1 Tax=Anisodus tanguticus TaxID=243964 RepID=A0AAE1T1Y3_9SOLA|nr:hypothetical protein RND71_001966 [Anisodus tanguticus]
MVQRLTQTDARVTSQRLGVAKAVRGSVFHRLGGKWSHAMCGAYATSQYLKQINMMGRGVLLKRQAIMSDLSIICELHRRLFDTNILYVAGVVLKR